MNKVGYVFGKLEVQVLFSDGERDKPVTVLRIHGITKEDAKAKLDKFRANNPDLGHRVQGFWQAEREWM